jgi:hypothetical protein
VGQGPGKALERRAIRHAARGDYTASDTSHDARL